MVKQRIETKLRSSSTGPAQLQSAIIATSQFDSLSLKKDYSIDCHPQQLVQRQ